MAAIIRSPKDFFCGLLLLAIAAVFAVGLFDLEIGSAFRMGPGYFPLVLTLLLAGLGIAILVNGLRIPGEPIGMIPWRAILLIVLPVVFFGATLRGLGFLPSLSIVVFSSTLASREWNLRFALVTTLLLVAACAAIFIFGLGLPISLFGPWVGGY
jgi:putative tricarboxylic transport membrane protein